LKYYKRGKASASSSSVSAETRGSSYKTIIAQHEKRREGALQDSLPAMVVDERERELASTTSPR
jgi:hypothetical protein